MHISLPNYFIIVGLIIFASSFLYANYTPNLNNAKSCCGFFLVGYIIGLIGVVSSILEFIWNII